MALVAHIAIAISCDPSLSVGAPDAVPLRFQGVVTGTGGVPLEGATVNLEQLFFVFQSPVATTRTGPDGRYTLDGESRCKRGTDLYSSPGNASMLVTYAAGYDQLSSVNISRPLYCVTDLQTVDFAMTPVRVP